MSRNFNIKNAHTELIEKRNTRMVSAKEKKETLQSKKQLDILNQVVFKHHLKDKELKKKEKEKKEIHDYNIEKKGEHDEIIKK